MIYPTHPGRLFFHKRIIQFERGIWAHTAHPTHRMNTYHIHTFFQMIKQMALGNSMSEVGSLRMKIESLDSVLCQIEMDLFSLFSSLSLPKIYTSLIVGNGLTDPLASLALRKGSPRPLTRLFCVHSVPLCRGGTRGARKQGQPWPVRTPKRPWRDC